MSELLGYNCPKCKSDFLTVTYSDQLSDEEKTEDRLPFELDRVICEDCKFKFRAIV